MVYHHNKKSRIQISGIILDKPAEGIKIDTDTRITDLLEKGLFG